MEIRETENSESGFGKMESGNRSRVTVKLSLKIKLGLLIIFTQINENKKITKIFLLKIMVTNVMLLFNLNLNTPISVQKNIFNLITFRKLYSHQRHFSLILL